MITVQDQAETIEVLRTKEFVIKSKLVEFGDSFYTTRVVYTWKETIATGEISELHTQTAGHK